MTVGFESDGSVAVVTIDRPDARNAVDRPTAEALVDACERFEADDGLAVMVLTGAGGTFCAGADLKAMAEPGGARVQPGGGRGRRPDGPDPADPGQAGDRGHRGPRGRRRPGARAVV